jgi:hypothetical protein
MNPLQWTFTVRSDAATVYIVFAGIFILLAAIVWWEVQDSRETRRWNRYYERYFDN